MEKALIANLSVMLILSIFIWIIWIKKMKKTNKSYDKLLLVLDGIMFICAVIYLIQSIKMNINILPSIILIIAYIINVIISIQKS